MWRFFSAAMLMFALAVPATAAEPVVDDEFMVVYRTDSSFADVREFVEMGITDRGMVVNNVAYISNMLERTRGDVGGAALYTEGEALEFCSATLSRDTMAADIHNIVFCPYVIAVYVKADEPDAVYVGYKRMPRVKDEKSRATLIAVEELLDEIVQDAVQF
ncbi:DUF302 domain-containing protein [Ectothiorhodospiraceae bacterium 2226]|nr:DUF302 domain-containing protein [Ectothiorhodospiraceae bacterium 2226]